MTKLSITLAEDKKPENLQMALTEVARRIQAGETCGMIHGLPWETRTGVDEDGNVTEQNPFTGGYTRHCGHCGMHLQTYNPPPQTPDTPCDA